MFITDLLFAFLILYGLEVLFLRLGIAKATAVQPAPPVPGCEPRVSVIVAARDEEQFIERCLTSIAESDYPAEKLEIIAVNDHSTDRTEELIRTVMQRYPCVRLVQTGDERGNLRGKTNAVAKAIGASTGEILMFTDADCTVSKSWVRKTVSYFDQNTGIVGGFTHLPAGSTFAAMQTLDWIVLFSISSGTAGWGIPLTVVGNNLALRRAAYDATGGFEKIPFSVTEDYAIVRAILRQKVYGLRFPLDSETIVASTPCASWRQLFRQKQRWSVGGLNMIAEGFLIAAVNWAFHLALVVSLFFVNLPVWLGVLAVAWIIDLWLVWKPLQRMGATKTLRYFAGFELYYTLYTITIPFLAILSKKVVWKERSW